MTRPPPSSPLFPYTTLFRSSDALILRDDVSEVVPLPPGTNATAVNQAEAFLSATDRKSTRLNSSHMSISYAVFCLKKKKKLSMTRQLHTTHHHALRQHVDRV